jgi:hypothetical protein
MMSRWNIQEVYGMHNMPGIPVGHFAIRPGAMMAAADTIEITVTGKGGHAAKPHDCIDTTVVAAHIIVALQTIASRGVDPLKQVVVSVCAVSTDSTAHNVIPQVVGTLSDGAHNGGGSTVRTPTQDELSRSLSAPSRRKASRGQECEKPLMPSNISRCLNAGGMGRQDWETETLVIHEAD